MFSWFPQLDQPPSSSYHDEQEYNDYEELQALEQIKPPTEVSKHDFSVIMEAGESDYLASISDTYSHDHDHLMVVDEMDEQEVLAPEHVHNFSDNLAPLHSVTRLRFGQKQKLTVPPHLQKNENLRITHGSTPSKTSTSSLNTTQQPRLSARPKLPWYPEDTKTNANVTTSAYSSEGNPFGPPEPFSVSTKAIYTSKLPTTATSHSPSHSPSRQRLSFDVSDHVSSSLELPLVSQRSRARLMAAPYMPPPQRSSRPSSRDTGTPQTGAPHYTERWESNLTDMERVYVHAHAQGQRETGSRGGSRGYTPGGTGVGGVRGGMRSNSREISRKEVEHNQGKSRIPDGGRGRDSRNIPSQLPPISGKIVSKSNGNNSTTVSRKNNSGKMRNIGKARVGNNLGGYANNGSSNRGESTIDDDIRALERATGIFDEILDREDVKKEQSKKNSDRSK